MSGFKAFLLRGNVVDLAIAVVIGAAFGALVQAFVKDIITPIIGAFGGLPDFSAWFFTINGSKFLIGDFINAVIAFVILAAIIYFFVVMPMERLMERFKPAPAVPVTTRDCPFCLSKIPVAATRCAFCTADFAGSERAGTASTRMGLVGQASAEPVAVAPGLDSSRRLAIPLDEIRGMDGNLKQSLDGMQIRYADELLERARTPMARRELAARLGMDEKSVLELANRADLMRIRGVTGPYADLLENAGVDTVKELAARSPANLYAKLQQVSAESTTVSVPPTLDEVTAWVAEAKSLPGVLEY